jgi:hypothetical protein
VKIEEIEKYIYAHGIDGEIITHRILVEKHVLIDAEENQDCRLKRCGNCCKKKNILGINTDQSCNAIYCPACEIITTSRISDTEGGTIFEQYK